MAKQRKRCSPGIRLCQVSRNQSVISQSSFSHTVDLKSNSASFQRHYFYICRTLESNWFLCHLQSSWWTSFLVGISPFSEPVWLCDTHVTGLKTYFRFLLCYYGLSRFNFEFCLCPGETLLALNKLFWFLCYHPQMHKVQSGGGCYFSHL